MEGEGSGVDGSEAVFHFTVRSYITQIFFLFLILQLSSSLPPSPCLGLVLCHIAFLCRRCGWREKAGAQCWMLFEAGEWVGMGEAGEVGGRVVRRGREATEGGRKINIHPESWSCMQMLCPYTPSTHTHTKPPKKKTHISAGRENSRKVLVFYLEKRGGEERKNVSSGGGVGREASQYFHATKRYRKCLEDSNPLWPLSIKDSSRINISTSETNTLWFEAWKLCVNDCLIKTCRNLLEIERIALPQSSWIYFVGASKEQAKYIFNVAHLTPPAPSASSLYSTHPKEKRGRKGSEARREGFEVKFVCDVVRATNPGWAEGANKQN